MKNPARSLQASFRKARLLGSTAALSASILLFGGSSQAASTLYDTTDASITCNTLFGTAWIKPPISSASTGVATVKVKITLGGCTVTGATPASPALSIVSGTLSGALTTSGSPGCAGLLSPSTITGNLVAKWKAASGQTLDFPSTTVSGGSVTGGIFTPGGLFMGSYGMFTFSSQTIQPNSAFAGGTPNAVAATSEDVGNLAAQCGCGRQES